MAVDVPIKNKGGNPNMVKGQPSVNPKGKPKGCKDRATLLKISLAAMEAAHPEGAAGWLKQQAKDRPVAYLQYVGKILPRESTINTNATPEGQYSDIVSKLEEATKLAETALEQADRAQAQAQVAQASAKQATRATPETLTPAKRPVGPD